MAKIDRYDGNLKAFAADATGTERTIFGDTAQSDTLDANITADFLRGWGIVGVNENPTKQDFDGLGFTLGQLLSYLHQVGVPEWNTAQEYYEGSVVTTLDGIYRLKSGGDGAEDPDTDNEVNWELAPTRAEIEDRVIRVTSIAAMEACSAPVGYVFSLNAGGRSGTFDVVAGDFSTELAADTLNGIYVGLADNSTGSTKVAKRRFNSTAHATWFGAVGDGVTDDTISIAASLQFIRSSVGLAAGYSPTSACVLQLGAGIFRLTSTLTVGSVRIHGVGHEMRYSNEETINAVGAGSYLYFDHAGKGIEFVSESVPIGVPQRSGSELVNFATLRNQPTPEAGWEPDLTLDWDIYSNDRHIIDFIDFGMKNPTKGIYLYNAGRSTFTRITGQPLRVGIQIEGTTDLVRFNSIHFWPFWSLSSDVRAYTRVNANAMIMGRVDGPIFGNFFCIFYRAGLELITDATGSATRMHVNTLYFDGGSYGIYVTSGVNDLIARIDSFYCFADAATPVSGRGLFVQSDNNEISIGHFESKFQQSSVIENTGTGSVIAIAHLSAKDWNRANGNTPALVAGTGSVITVDKVLRGTTGTGTPAFISSFGKHDVNLGLGRFEGSTDASGDATITHLLPVQPNRINAGVGGTVARTAGVHSITSTTFKVRVSDSSGVAVASTAVDVAWHAGIAN
jgi:hypothetical protein